MPDGSRRRAVSGAAAVACGLMVLEDPVVIAVRRHLQPLTHGLAVDVGLAAVMVGYNYRASRYVVRLSSAAEVVAAIARIEDEQRQAAARRRSRRFLRWLNPFTLVRIAAERLGGLATRAADMAHHRRRVGLGHLLRDLAAVNLFGVPGVGLERAARGATVSSTDSLRHSGLFVASWFAGANLVEAIVAIVGHWSVSRTASRPVFAAVGTVFGTLTDPRHPIGALVVTLVVGLVLRLAWRVDRLVAAGGGPPEAAVSDSH